MASNDSHADEKPEHWEPWWDDEVIEIGTSVLLPLFDQSWRTVMLLWGGFALAASVVWLVIASICGPRVKGFQQEHEPRAEHHSSAGVIKEIVRHPAIQLVLVMAVGAFLFNHGLNNWLPELLRNTGMSIVDAGYWAAFSWLVGIIGSLIFPRLATPERRFKIAASR